MHIHYHALFINPLTYVSNVTVDSLVLGLDEVRQQTQEFVDQYTKQLLADFKHIKPSEDQSHAKSSVQDGITDPNKVSHKDSNPLLPSVRHSSPILHPMASDIIGTPHTTCTHTYMLCVSLFFSIFPL